MIRLIIGLGVFFSLAILLGAVFHWAAGVAFIVAPITITYLILKVSPGFRQVCDKRLEALVADSGK